MTRRALLTGATGFIGSHLASELVNAGWHVRALQRRSSSDAATSRLTGLGVEVVRFDRNAEVPALVADGSPDVVFHLATHYLKSHVADDIDVLVDSNIAFGAHVFEGVVGTGAKVVSAMSYFQYEGGQPAPASLYAAMKQAFASIAAYYRDIQGVDHTEVVLFDTFGPGDERAKLVPAILDAFLAGSPVRLGSPHQLIDLLYVDDAVAGLVAAAADRTHPTIALRAPVLVTVEQIVQAFVDVSGRSPDIQFAVGAPTSDLVLRAGDWPAPDGWRGGRALRDGVAALWSSAVSPDVP